MAEIVLVREPIICPICFKSDRIGFLKNIMEGENGSFLAKGEIKVIYQCGTCGSLYGEQ